MILAGVTWAGARRRKASNGWRGTKHSLSWENHSRKRFCGCQAQACTLEKWASAHNFPVQCRSWPFAGRQPVEAALVGAFGCLGFHSVGVRLSLDPDRACACPDHVHFGKHFSLFGLCFLRFEPILLGMGGWFSSYCVFCWLAVVVVLSA